MHLDKKNIHFVGVGGIGMSGIATVLIKKGYKVTGSDAESSNITRGLESLGARIYEGHAPSNVSRDVDVLVYSTSISKDNPEMKEARRRKIPLAHRAQILAEIFNNKKGVAITGTHGKTTTTSLISVMFKSLGLDPTVLAGGEILSLGGNAVLGKGAFVVAEADESDSSFINLKPYIAVITNIEEEHLDHFKDIQDIKKAYRSFARNIKNTGALFYNHDDVNTRDAVKGLNIKTATFGLNPAADIYAVDIRMKGFDTSFDCVRNSKKLGRVRLKIPGRHNVLNALAAIQVGLSCGLSFDKIAGSLSDFTGAKRRFQLRIDTLGVMLIEDYAHHPTEIRSVLAACRNWEKKRVIVIFQPHRYSRTKFFADEFGTCFGGTDKLILTDIYPASEKPIDGVSINMIRERVKKSGIKDIEVLDKGSIAAHVLDILKPGDMVLVLGAGDIKKVADEIEIGLRFAGLAKELSASVEGTVRLAEPLSRHTSFKIGGPARVWVEPDEVSGLRRTLEISDKHGAGVFIIGNGSNLLVSEKGIDKVVVSLCSAGFKKVSFRGTTVTAGAGFSLPRLVKMSCARGLGGLESLVGIPGTLGGAIYMNAGGWTNPVFKNMSDLVVSVKVMDRGGRLRTLRRQDIKFEYRNSNLAGNIILEATLKLTKSKKDELIASSVRFIKMKKEKQVLDVPSAGCIFKNPANSNFTCGQMIDMLGLKGLRIGGAEISTKHANFIINRKNATCDDVLALARIIKEKVKTNYGIDLEMEAEAL
jgi:UDP-N-acetylmuramate--L-alanine ligase/UDP-N-acetylenolpyruvoylglucosamine reductase